MKKKAKAIIFGCILIGFMAGCGEAKTYKDGVYQGQSSVYQNDDGSDDGNGYGVVNITISGGKIIDCTYETFDIDGTKKDSEYGKEGGAIANKDYYNKAQKAVAACDEYANMLVANGMIDGIDAISGATINYNEFVEAVDNALKSAQE